MRVSDAAAIQMFGLLRNSQLMAMEINEVNGKSPQIYILRIAEWLDQPGN
jgi:hypothetical protein